MADNDNSAGNGSNTSSTQIFHVDGETVLIKNSEFIANSDLSRDGSNLVMTLEKGETVVIEDYFSASITPTILSSNGMALTPQLVNSFIHHSEFAQTGGINDVSPVGAVKEISGDATITRTDGTIENVNLGTVVYEGDVVETNDDGAVNIIFIDETEFAVSENAKLAIDEYVFDPSTSEGKTNFSILRGVFVFTSGIIGRDDPDDVEIQTPVGSIGIRGTIIAGTIDPDGGNNQITVVEGAIVIRNALGESTLSTQFETIRLASFNSQMVNVGNLDPVQMNQNFGSVSGVSASLFSAINDAAPQETEDSLPAQEAVPQSEKSMQAPTGSSENETGKSSESAPESTNAITDIALPATNLLSGLENKLESVESGLKTSLLKTALSGTDLSSLGNQILTSNISTNSVSNTGTGQTNNLKPAEVNPVSPPDTNVIPPPTIIERAVYNLNDPNLSSRYHNIATQVDSAMGSSFAKLGDINGDGRSDFAFTGSNGVLYTFRTGSGLSMLNLGSHITGNIFSNTLNISSGGDINRDGLVDLIIGAPDATGFGGITSGQTFFLTPADYALSSQYSYDTAALLTFGSMLGSDVTYVDLNSDGYSNAIISFDAYTSGNGGLLIQDGLEDFYDINENTNTATYISGPTNSLLGHSLANAGDINKDGFDDLIVGTEGTLGNAYVIYGGMSVSTLGPAIGRPIDALNFGFYVTGGSDVNRDGYSDFMVTSESTIHGDQVHLYNGNNIAGPTATFYDSRVGWELNAATMMGDFNGDGIDDFAVSTSNGTDNQIFVLFGRQAGFQGQFDINFGALNTLDPRFGNAFIWNGSGEKIELADVGDVNGDGLTDLAIGAYSFNNGLNTADDGAIKIVYGSPATSVIKDGDIRDGNISANIIRATGNNQSLLGNADANIFQGMEFSGLSISAGAGNDVIRLHSAGMSHKTIDGGSGMDRLFLTGNGGVLDFSSTGPGGMTLSNIEEIILTGNNQSLQLETKDIFRLLQESTNDTLRITVNGTGNNLDISKSGTDIGFSSMEFTGELGADSNADGYYEMNFGNYTVLVDTNISGINFS